MIYDSCRYSSIRRPPRTSIWDSLSPMFSLCLFYYVSIFVKSCFVWFSVFLLYFKSFFFFCMPHCPFLSAPVSSAYCPPLSCGAREERGGPCGLLACWAVGAPAPAPHSRTGADRSADSLPTSCPVSTSDSLSRPYPLLLSLNCPRLHCSVHTEHCALHCLCIQTNFYTCVYKWCCDLRRTVCGS